LIANPKQTQRKKTKDFKENYIEFPIV
jgi:hypothetical protein